MSPWITACAFDAIDDEDVLRFDFAGHSHAICRYEDKVNATNGLCIHERVQLCKGLVMEHVITCLKHNGRFDIRDGRSMGAPVCVNLKTYPAEVEDGNILTQLGRFHFQFRLARLASGRSGTQRRSCSPPCGLLLCLTALRVTPS